jgi:hypothetical protein
VSPDLLDLATEKLLDGAQSNGFALTMMHGIGATLNVWGRVMQGRYLVSALFSPSFALVYRLASCST